MPRPRRIHYEGAVYHVTSRGNERRKIVVDDGDRVQFLRVLADVIEDEKVTCHAWVLMDNHYHLLLETPAGNLSTAMKHLNGIYTQRFNKKQHRVGHLFQGRFKAIIVEKDAYLKELCRYLVLNPVRAMMVKSPEQWKWSSYRATAGLERKPSWLEVDWILGQFGKTESRARVGYRAFVREGVKAKSSPWEDLHSRIYLGGQDFLRKIDEIGKKHRSLDVPKYQKRVIRANPDEILIKVAKVYGEKPEEILKSGKRKRDSRDAAIYLLRTESGLSLKAIGAKMGVGFSAVGNQWARIKTRALSDKGFAKQLLKCKV